jgi:hypothetical protein
MNNCPVCESLETMIVIDVEHYPISIFPHKLEESMHLPTDRILVYVCKNCGHRYLNGSVHLDYIYKIAYNNYPHQYGSETFSYREEFSRFFSGLGDLNVRDLLEIGSNNFSNLSEFTNIADNVTGISLEAHSKQYGNVNLIQGSFDTFDFDVNYSIIISRFVLEHVIDLRSHLAKAYDILNISGYLLVQVPNPDKMFANNLFNVLAHEHLHYFTENSLKTLFSLNGFEIIEFLNSDSLLIFAKKSARTENKFVNKNLQISSTQTLLDIDKFKTIGNFINSEFNSNRKVIVYGAGLNLIGLFWANPLLSTNRKLLIVDDNVLIIGKCMPNSNIVIQLLDKIQIDKNSTIVILANTAYQSLILEKLNKIGLRGRLFNANLVELNFFN